MSYGCSTYATIVIEPVAVHEQSILLATESEYVFRLHVRTVSQPEAAQVLYRNTITMINCTISRSTRSPVHTCGE
jgi:hypothetical protein